MERRVDADGEHQRCDDQGVHLCALRRRLDLRLPQQYVVPVGGAGLHHLGLLALGLVLGAAQVLNVLLDRLQGGGQGCRGLLPRRFHLAPQRLGGRGHLRSQGGCLGRADLGGPVDRAHVHGPDRVDPGGLGQPQLGAVLRPQLGDVPGVVLAHLADPGDVPGFHLPQVVLPLDGSLDQGIDVLRRVDYRGVEPVRRRSRTSALISPICHTSIIAYATDISCITNLHRARSGDNLQVPAERLTGLGLGLQRDA